MLFLIPSVFAQAELNSIIKSVDELILVEIGLIIAAAAILAYFASLLRQPLIPAYIFAGVLIGPIASLAFGVSLISDFNMVRGLSQLGITFLLFTVGVELDLSRLKDVGFAAAAIGIIEVIVMFFLGFMAATAMGFSGIGPAVMGMVVALSSTMVVIKILADQNELDTLHGRITLGILLIQDVIVVIALSLLTAAPDAGALTPMVDSLIKGVGLFSMAIVLSRYISPHIMRLVSRSIELLFLTSLFYCFGFAIVSIVLGFSPAIGGFLGGLSLAVFPHNLEISSRIKPLRDFFAIMFFVSLGMQILPNLPQTDMGPITLLILAPLVFAGLVIIVKPMVINILCVIFGYERRTSFLSSISLAQISEFSLILFLLPAVSDSLGTNPAEFLITVMVAIISISITPYLIRYGNSLYTPLLGALKKLEGLRLVKRKLELEHLPEEGEKLSGHIVVFGAHVMGQEIIETLRKLGKKIMVVDNNPEIIKKLIEKKVPSIYGDAQDPEVLGRLKLEDATMVISTLPREEDSKFIINEINARNPDAILFVTAATLEHAIEFYREGADYIIHFKLLGGKEASKQMEAALNKGKKHIVQNKIHEISKLEKKRREELWGNMKKQVVIADLEEGLDEMKEKLDLGKIIEKTHKKSKGKAKRKKRSKR